VGISTEGGRSVEKKGVGVAVLARVKVPAYMLQCIQDVHEIGFSSTSKARASLEMCDRLPHRHWKLKRVSATDG
jgi:hypothetical protein